MKVGFIGTGSMGSMLIETLIEAKTVNPEDIHIINRSTEKAQSIKNAFPAINQAASMEELVSSSDWLFLCVKPKEMPELFQTIAPLVSKDQLAISITSPVSINDLETTLPCKTCRVIPSILNRAQSGSMLISFSETCQTSDRAALINFVSTIASPLLIEENITRVSSDIVSCGPAFFSFLAQRFIEGAVNETEISAEDATELTTSMLIGLGKLLEQGHYTLPTLQERVCVPGGITGVGIEVLERIVGDQLNELFRATHHKYATEKKKLSEEFSYK